MLTPELKEFDEILSHELNFQRYNANKNVYMAEDINALYQSFENYKKQQNAENLQQLKSAMQTCKDNNRSFSFRELEKLLPANERKRPSR